MLQEDKKKMANKKAFGNTLHIIVGAMLIISGFAYIFNLGSIGLIITTIGLLIEAIVNQLTK